MIYLDNAATTFPKPTRVLKEVTRAVTEYGGNPGRGTHALSLAAAERVFACRELLADFLGLGAPERVAFTLNTTHALNLALGGFLRRGDHVLYSELEHNAVRRPICHLMRTVGITATPFPVLGLTPAEMIAGLASRMTARTKAVVCMHASNVCSVTLPIAAIGRFCRRNRLFFIVDAAQSAGLLPIHMENMHIDALAVPAHKGLYGIQGCGALLLGERFTPSPLMQGGSGVNSLDEQMPELPPERFEAGTLPTPAIAALFEGIRSLQEESSDLHAHECALYRALRDRLGEFPDVTIYTPEHEGAVLLFNKRDVPCVDVARVLSAKGICVRAGLHCAPLAHKALGTPPDGAVRVSFGRYNSIQDLDALWHALREL